MQNDPHTDPRGTEYPFRGGLAVLLPVSVCNESPPRKASISSLLVTYAPF